jgi:glutathione synthase
MQIGMLISSANVVRPTWTTAHLAHAALLAGDTVRFIEPDSMEVTTHGRVITRAYILDAPELSPTELAQKLSSRRLIQRYVDVGSLDILLMRANPLTPAVLNLALMAQERGVRVVNDPTGIARTRSKSWLASLTDVPSPPTLITSDPQSARSFAEGQANGVVLKPALGSGGRGVQMVKNPRDVSRAMADAARAAAGPVVVQGYLTEADAGEKRVFWVDGQIVGGYLRKRAPGAFHHNLQRGGLPERVDITETDRAICNAIAPHLRRNGIVLAGLDIIGGALVECNTLNPGGIHYAESFRETDGPSIAAITLQLITRTWNTTEARHA